MSTWLEAALLTRPPKLLHALLPGAEWLGPATGAAGQPVLYLTFDDGPIPEETPWVLAQLASYQALATFFCVGQNLERYPDIARAALAAGHRLGNHTQHHRSAWASAGPAYLAGVVECQATLAALLAECDALPGSLRPQSVVNASVSAENQQVISFDSELIANNLPSEVAGEKPLFRPPYGRLTWPLLRRLQPDFRVIMWSVLTRDYDPTLGLENCLRDTLAAVRPGDIIVFHDSRKASARLRYVLPRLLAHFAELGYVFSTL